jgi:predicted GIY-YIG superfamily endonuclease
MNEPEYYNRQKAMWDENELQEIKNEYETDKMTISEIADAHFRTPGSISYKLKKMELITHHTLARGYLEYKESKLYKTIVARGKLEDEQKKLRPLDISNQQLIKKMEVASAYLLTNQNKMPAYVYTLNLKGGNKYVGYTKNPKERLSQHFSGNGAQWTQKHQPVSVNSIQEVSSVAYAKKLETIIYHKMKDYHGGSKVRGAGNTRSD